MWREWMKTAYQQCAPGEGEEEMGRLLLRWLDCIQRDIKKAGVEDKDNGLR